MTYLPVKDLLIFETAETLTNDIAKLYQETIDGKYKCLDVGPKVMDHKNALKALIVKDKTEDTGFSEAYVISGSIKKARFKFGKNEGKEEPEEVEMTEEATEEEATEE